MSKFLKKYVHWFVFMISIGILFFFYSDVLIAPNDYLFSNTGDGIKNYYTYLFHAKHDVSFSEFTGMNYPYGEQITYTDGQPLLSFLIKIFGVQEYGVGIMNSLILLSFPLAAMFISKIFKFKNTPVWINIVSSIIIAYMAPQTLRIDGHFSLSYSFIIPLVWWQLLRLSQFNWWRFLFLFILILAVLFTHPYLGLIIILFIGLYYLISWLLDRKKYLYLIYNIVLCIIPVIIFKLYTALTDNHINRDPNPSGFFSNYGDWKSIFTPYLSPYNKFYRVTLGIDHVNWETSAYLGIGINIIIILLIVSLIVLFRKIPWFKVFEEKKESIAFVLAAVLMLFFSFCIPFKYDWAKSLLEVLTPLKQFRSLGRFAWVFYYVFSVFIIVLFSRVHKTLKLKWLSGSIFIIAIGLQSYELVDLHFFKAEKLSKQKNIFLDKNLSSDESELVKYITDNDYDGFLFLPITHLSSEKVYLMGDQQSEFESLWISYHSGLPMINSATARMSLNESYKVNNLFGPKFVRKEFLNDVKTKRLAIIYNSSNLRAETSEWVIGMQPEKKFGDLELVSFQDSIFFDANEKDKIFGNSLDARYELSSGFKSDTIPSYFYFNSFEDDSLTKNFGFFDLKSKFGEKHEWNQILKLPCKNIPDGAYKFSFWYSLNIDKPTVQALLVEKDRNGNEIWRDQKLVSNTTHIVENWCHTELELIISKETDTMSFFITCGGNHNPYNIDAIMIRPVNIDVFKYVEVNRREYLNYNNYLLSK